jgi:Zn-finger nucleic acid-binding protein
MTCEHCGASLRPVRDLGVFVCDYCQSTFEPPEGDAGVLAIAEVAEKCPACRAGLWDGSLESFSLKFCRQCGGMLVAMDDLVALVETLRARRDAPVRIVTPRSVADANRHLHCPQCGGEMDAHPYGGPGNINIDSCERCAVVWLDRGELKRIASAADHQPIYLEHEDAEDAR